MASTCPLSGTSKAVPSALAVLELVWGIFLAIHLLCHPFGEFLSAFLSANLTLTPDQELYGQLKWRSLLELSNGRESSAAFIFIPIFLVTFELLIGCVDLQPP